MRKVSIYPVRELLPHRGSMVLIDDLVDWGDDYVSVTVDHLKPNIFTDSQGNVPAWVGIEYMAQAIGIYAGLKAKSAGKPINVGFLLGTRQYTSYIDCFRPGQRIDIKAKVLMHDEYELAVFECSIFSDDLLASAQIKAIQPDDPHNVVAQLKN